MTFEHNCTTFNFQQDIPCCTNASSLGTSDSILLWDLNCLVPCKK